MSHVLKLSFIGGDLRQYYMVQQLLSKGFLIAVYGLPLNDLTEHVYHATSLKEAMNFSNTIITPIPFSRDQKTIFSNDTECDLSIENFLSELNSFHQVFGGSFSKGIRDELKMRNVPFYDFMQMESVSIANAIATAEGSIVEAITRSPINLHGSECLVLGFGRCAKILADKLKGLNASVTIGARNEEALAYADAYGYHALPISMLSKGLDNFQFIFNSIPSMILDESLLSHVKKDVTIIDIASSPGGTNFDYCKQMKINASLCLGLPGKYAAKTSAEILNSAILNIIGDTSSVE